MPVSTVFSPIVIDGNITSPGYINGGAGPVLKSYNGIIFVAGDAVISNNSLSGIKVGSGSHIFITSGSSVITNNYLIRGGNTIGSYIGITSTTDQVITNNIFDSTTVDGISETLIVGQSLGTTYEKNKNQTKYASIPVNELQYSFDFGSTTSNYSITMDYNATSTVSDRLSGNFGIQASTAGARVLKIASNISNYIPANVKLIGSVIQFRFNFAANIDTSAPGSINFYLARDAVDIATSYATPTTLNTLTNAVNIATSTISYNTSADYTAATGVNNYIAMDYSSIPTAVSNDNNLLFGIVMNLSVNSTAGNSVYKLSPLILKYRW